MVVTAVDLFCGAGGLSAGLALACEELDRDVDLAAVNHWERAIESHRENHPWADHYHTKVESTEPRSVVDGDVDLITGGPQCTHYSKARGGKPVDEQKRASPWHVLDWVSKLRPDHVLLENVPEFESWGPVIDDQPTRNGQFFEAWTQTFRGLGYQIGWRTLTAADYGDATTRKRLFVIASREHQPCWPDATHADDWRPAAEITDWTEPGESIWRRDRPLVQNTMRRIADGIRRFGSEEFAPYADALAELTTDDVERMQTNAVDVAEAATTAERRDEPFLVSGPVAEPEDGLAADDGERTGLCVPYVLGQHGGSRPRRADDQPLPTVTTDGHIKVLEPESFVLPRNGAYRGLHSNPAYDPTDRPLHTVTAKNTDGHFVTPYLVSYHGNDDAQPVDDPLPTVTTRDRFALVLPQCLPWGLDVRYRMLQPRELAAAQGFPADYEFVGTKTEVTEQIGNAVPVNTAKALCRSLLTIEDPTLGSFSGGERDV
jgi:DNA (cytosine-5)-methyltransferase 1